MSAVRHDKRRLARPGPWIRYNAYLSYGRVPVNNVGPSRGVQEISGTHFHGVGRASRRMHRIMTRQRSARQARPRRPPLAPGTPAEWRVLEIRECEFRIRLLEMRIFKGTRHRTGHARTGWPKAFFWRTAWADAPCIPHPGPVAGPRGTRWRSGPRWGSGACRFPAPDGA